MKTKLILLIFFITLMACATNGTIGEKKSVKPRYHIPNEEIVKIVGASDALDVISRSRPVWLRSKGIEPSVYMNGIQMGGLDALRSISINSIKDIKFLTPSEATTMYGTNNMGGVIEIRTR
tara:strand:+ start:206 stop:568 length:363 start_codon:yes stop_codon:yes gene_type:complete